MLCQFLFFLATLLAPETCGAYVNSTLLADFKPFPPNKFDSNKTTKIAHSFSNIDEHKTAGLMMLDHPHKAIVISFRGTISNTDWDTNLDFVHADASDICGEGCFAHSGFLGSWRGVSGIVSANWRVLLQQYPQYSTIVTGHSLGGALAHLCAASLKHMAPDATMSLFTFASPRVGNQVFADFISQKFGAANHRVTHLNDPVPRLPGRMLGFVHTSPEYHITSPHIRKVLSADKKTLASPANMAVEQRNILALPDPENEAGNVGYSCTNVAMHDEYFIHIPDCVVDTKTPLLRSFAAETCHILLMCCNWGLNFGTMWKAPGPDDPT